MEVRQPWPVVVLNCVALLSLVLAVANYLSDRSVCVSGLHVGLESIVDAVEVRTARAEEGHVLYRLLGSQTQPSTVHHQALT